MDELDPQTGSGITILASHVALSSVFESCGSPGDGNLESGIWTQALLITFHSIISFSPKQLRQIQLIISPTLRPGRLSSFWPEGEESSCTPALAYTSTGIQSGIVSELTGITIASSQYDHDSVPFFKG